MPHLSQVASVAQCSLHAEHISMSGWSRVAPQQLEVFMIVRGRDYEFKQDFARIRAFVASEINNKASSSS